jgi:hypothetical protein
MVYRMNSGNPMNPDEEKAWRDLEVLHAAKKQRTC